MASLTQWPWVWAYPGRYWRTGKPAVLCFMRSQRVRHDLATEQQQCWGRKLGIIYIRYPSEDYGTVGMPYVQRLNKSCSQSKATSLQAQETSIYTWNLKFKEKRDEVGMCFWKNKLSLGNYSLKKNKNITYKHRKQTVKSLFLKMSLSASNMHCQVACLRFQLLSHKWHPPNCAAQSTLTNGHHTGWERSA